MRKNPLLPGTTKLFISTYVAIKMLKKRGLVPSEVNNYASLPKDPDKRIILVHVDPKYVVGSSIENNFLAKDLKKKEIAMNYSQMCEAVREGKRCSRPTWKQGEYVFSNGKVLIHTTPYWTNEYLNQELNGYPYVCEQVDVVASDWFLVA